MKKILLSLCVMFTLVACQPETQSKSSQQNVNSEKDNVLTALLPEKMTNYAEKYDIAQFMLVAQKNRFNAR